MTSQGVDPSVSALPDMVDIDTRFLQMTAKEFREHTVRDFLERPIIVSAPSTSWASSVGQGEVLTEYDFPDALLTNTMYQEKLKGFTGLRATLNVKLQVNSQPFQAGRLMLQYIPYAQYMKSHVDMINSTLQGRSGCPRTDLDLSVGTEITMEIPYVSPHLFYNLITGQGTFGRLAVVVYSPLADASSDSASVEYTVWAWMTNVQVEYPTGAPMKIADFGPTFQMALEDKQLADNHSPSAGLGQIASGLSDLSRIPIVGNIFTKPAWISSQMSNMLKLLGYSKPTSKGDVQEFKMRGVARMANYNGLDMSHKIALSSDNEIETQSGLAGTSCDEMALSRIISIPNFWDNFSWKTDQSNGVIWQNYVTPLKIKPLSTEVTDRFACTHMGYVANTFGMWRGSINYTFKFVKTQFHSGRLMISFIPYSFNVDTTTSNGDTNKCYRTIVDLRDSTEVTFAVPYVSSRPWMYCTRPESSWLVDGDDNLIYNCVTGVIQVEVLNQLKATSTVVGDINVIVEVAAGTDMKFANPSDPSYVPYSGSLAASVKGFEMVEVADVQMFSGTNVSIPRNEAQKGQSPDSIDMQSIDSNWSPEALCVGEKITSVRQLIKRFGTSGVGVDLGAADDRIGLSPFSVVIPPTTTDSVRRFTPLEYWYPLFAFYRGSMRWKLRPLQQSTVGTLVQQTTPNYPFVVKQFCSLQDSMNAVLNSWNSVPFVSRADNVVVVQNTSSIALAQSSTTEIYPNLEGMIEIEVPYYNSSHITPTYYTPVNTGPLVEPGVTFSKMFKGLVPPQAVVISAAQNPSTTEEGNFLTVNHYVAAGDDFSFFYILGVPPLVTLNRS